MQKDIFGIEGAKRLVVIRARAARGKEETDRVLKILVDGDKQQMRKL